MESNLQQRRRHLDIGVHYEPSGVDPHLGAAELALQMTNAVFDTLVVRTAEGEYLPGLASAWEVLDAGCRYRFHLRSGVKFHDGTRFDAQAVRFSLERARDPANRSQLAGAMLGPYLGSDVIDASTLDIRLQRPYALLLDALSQGWLAPVSPTAVARLGSDFARAPVGTGPFVFAGWVAGKWIDLQRNPDYAWGPAQVRNRGVAHLHSIRFHFIASPSERSQALREGRVDAVFYTAPADVAEFRADPRWDVRTWPIRGIPVCLMMNVTRAPTDDLSVRRAISHALDRDALVAEVFHGEFERAWGPVSQFTLGFEPSVKALYPFDMDKARELLDQASWDRVGADGIRQRDGQRLRVSFYALPVNFYPEFGAIVTAQLKRVGIEVEVRLLEPRAWIQAGMRGEHHLIPQGKYAASSQLLTFVYHSRHSGDGGYGWSKRGPQHCAGLDELLESAEQTLEPERFIPLFQQVQREVMEQALAVPLHCNTNIVAYRKGLQGLEFDATGAYPYFHDASFEAHSADAGVPA
ncbi:MAG: ABC transporter substrate-binding protein [Pseudomonas sp.]